MESDPIYSVVLKSGREKSLRHRHPWIFSGAIERVEGEPAMGDTVKVVAHDGASGLALYGGLFTDELVHASTPPAVRDW